MNVNIGKQLNSSRKMCAEIHKAVRKLCLLICKQYFYSFISLTASNDVVKEIPFIITKFFKVA